MDQVFISLEHLMFCQLSYLTKKPGFQITMKIITVNLILSIKLLKLRNKLSFINLRTIISTTLILKAHSLMSCLRMDAFWKCVKKVILDKMRLLLAHGKLFSLLLKTLETLPLQDSENKKVWHILKYKVLKAKDTELFRVKMRK